MKTIQKNILMALFMGMVYDNHGQPNKYWELTDEQNFVSKKPFPQDGDLEFHSDWNWLIEVIKKIRGIINTELSVDDFDKHRGLEQRLNPYNYDIESIYEGCVEFIKWYNQQS